ncbi:hypothetical protein J1N35_038399 [Gossypium stocksii]|uniref:Uncharacterized protein n=1 Tax=Gossypium stocksii TaxID=47602 RepID=A0A9D3ZMU8_9ROSI|nr:hypothetical protein J1N35_038399 [Gossypium stocksii]
MATEKVPTIDTPHHSSNTGEAVHSQDTGGLILQQGQLVVNPAFLVHKKQDKFLAS